MREAWQVSTHCLAEEPRPLPGTPCTDRQPQLPRARAAGQPLMPSHGPAHAAPPTGVVMVFSTTPLGAYFKLD